jgi:hypothetical protein
MTFTPDNSPLVNCRENLQAAGFVPRPRSGTPQALRRLRRMEMHKLDFWADLPFKMKLMLLHVQRAERERRPVPAALGAGPEGQHPVVIEPIAHRRVS